MVLIEDTDTGVSNVNSSMVNSPAIVNQQSSEFMRWQFGNEEPVGRLMNRLLGLRYNQETGKMEDFITPLINQEGANNILMMLEILSDKIIQLSHYDKEEIDTTISEFEHLLVRTLFSHKKMWGVRTSSDDETIKFLVKEFVKSNFNRGLKGEAYKGLSNSTQHTEIVNERQQQKPSIIKRILPNI